MIVMIMMGSEPWFISLCAVLSPIVSWKGCEFKKQKQKSCSVSNIVLSCRHVATLKINPFK